jgi:formylglycine-generating enzyme
MKKHFLILALAATIASCGTTKNTADSGSKSGNRNSKAPATILVKGNENTADFHLGKYEVTQAEYEKVMGENPSKFKGNNLPVENITYQQALEYCNKLSEMEGLSPVYDLTANPATIIEGTNGYRLPTKEEWRYAASGGSNSAGYKFSGSNNSDEVGWHKGNGAMKTHPVGSKKANELGFFDMSGNVYEFSYSTRTRHHHPGRLLR